MIITKNEAMEIAQDAMVNAGFTIEEFSGYWQIWRDDDDIENNWAVAINKEADDNGDDQHFAIYVSCPQGEGWWEYTDTLDESELAEQLLKIAICCDVMFNSRQ